MTPLRPFGVVVVLALIVGVAVVSVGMFAMQSDDSSDADPVSTPDSAVDSNAEDDDVSGSLVDDSDAVPEADDTDVVPEADDVASESEAETPSATPDETEEPTPVPPQLSEEELEEYQPNELGQIMVLMYHRFETREDPDDVWTRTPDQFRQDLQWLYDNDFYVIPIRDYVRNEIEAPAGKRPVVLTFDDSTVGQFRMVEQDDGSVAVDPDSAIGILEEFFNRYDDFGRGGLFSILPNAPFAWPDAPEQLDYAREKLQWLVDNGYEIGNHTVGHVNLREIPDDEIKSELARAEDMIQEYVPEAEVTVLAVPFGVYPAGGDTTIFRGWEYEGRQYELEGALMVGAEPAPSPVHAEFDPMWIPRINADDEQLDQWFSFVEQNPGIMYVSDGNPDTVTIPEELHPWLVDTLDEDKAEGKSIIRY